MPLKVYFMSQTKSHIHWHLLRNEPTVRFNELGHVCSVVPGGLSLRTEISPCCLPFPIWLCRWLPMFMEARRTITSTWPQDRKNFLFPFLSKMLRTYPTAFLYLSSTPFHVIIKFPLWEPCRDLLTFLLVKVYWLPNYA